MGYVSTVLALAADRAGRAQRRTTVRHTHLGEHQLGLVVVQMAHEPFSAVAVGIGTPDDLDVAIVVEPRNPVLLYQAMTPLAQRFCEWFREPSDSRDVIITPRSHRRYERATDAPQLLVPNRSTVEVVRRWGRRFAYLPITGDLPVDPALREFGTHLQFLGDHAYVPGQALVVPATTLLRRHWVTAQSDFEDENLAVLDAWIEPNGRPAFEAARAVEDESVGPLLQPAEENEIFERIGELNAVRRGSTDPDVVARLRPRLEPLCRQYLDRSWALMWRSIERERANAEAPHAERRWMEDRTAYTQHLDYIDSGGLRRARDSIKRAVLLRGRLEEAQSALEAEEAMDDPLVMAELEMTGKAFGGEIVHVDTSHQEQGPKRRVTRPLVTIETTDRCLMPIDREVWWEANPKVSGKIQAIVPDGDGSHVTIKIVHGLRGQTLPAMGEAVCFCKLDRGTGPQLPLPHEVPWTHRAPDEIGPQAIDQANAPAWEAAPDA